MNKFRDIAYNFEYDNPFENDSQKIRLQKLLNFISENPKDFMIDDYINKLLFKNVKVNDPKLKENITDNRVCNKVKDFFKTLKNIPQTLKDWANNGKVFEGPEEDEEKKEEEEKNEEEDKNEEEEIVKINKNKFAYSVTEGITNYDISSSRLLTYNELRELAINIARSLLAKNLNTDIEIQKLETKKRKDLIIQIQKYKNIKKIAALINDDITDMSINQLEICLEQCKKYHETFKLQEIIKSSLNGGKAIFSAALPNGIRIGKKRIKLNGIGDELINTLFDSTTVIGKSFDNIIQKYNFHINDDALILLKIGELFIKNIKIENIEEEQPKDPIVESVPEPIKKVETPRIQQQQHLPRNSISMNTSISTMREIDEYSSEDDEEEEDEEEEV